MLRKAMPNPAPARIKIGWEGRRKDSRHARNVLNMIGLFILRIPGECCKCGARRCDSRVDHGMVMRAWYKTGLVRRGGQINAVIQHGVEKGFEARHIAAGNLTEAGGRGGRKIQAE